MDIAPLICDTNQRSRSAALLTASEPTRRGTPPQRLTTGTVQKNLTTSDLYRAATTYHRKPVILEPEALPFGPGWSANLKLG